MNSLTFDIRHADGRVEQTTAHGPRVLIGSGAHCDVKLSADQAALEHVIIEVLGAGPAAGWHLRCLAQTPPASIDGAPFSTLRLGATALLRVGGAQIQIAQAQTVAKAKGPGASVAAVAKLLVIVALGTGIAVVAQTPPVERFDAAPPTPELFTKATPSCPRTDLSEARAIAEDQRAIADGARERSPFDPREARAAITSYETASACFRIAQNVEASEEAAQNAKRLREEVLLDFRARRVRLERLIALKDYELASQDVTVLLALTENQPSKYAQWLRAAAQEIKSSQQIKPK